MPSEVDHLAPLQLIMLRDSLADREPGVHVEQVEIVFAEAVAGEHLAAAWALTVAATEVLQTTFVISGHEPAGWKLAEHVATLEWTALAPARLDKWLAADRLRPLLVDGTTPWRAVYWPQERRLIWTFHHALLDGRSITRILRVFFQCLHEAIPPTLSGITVWTPPDAAMKARAERIFQQDFAGLKAVGEFSDSPVPTKAVLSLGKEVALRLQSAAEAMRVSPSTLLTWSWGQAVMNASGGDTAIVEQVRCGAPQKGRTGFTMNTLPIAIPRATAHPLECELHNFRAQLLALRMIESIAAYDLPPGVMALTNSPWSSVIMIERGTPAHMIGGGACAASITFHESPATCLTAVACHLPDLQLEVEGHRNAQLLDLWAAELARLL